MHITNQKFSFYIFTIKDLLNIFMGHNLELRISWWVLALKKMLQIYPWDLWLVLWSRVTYYNKLYHDILQLTLPKQRVKDASQAYQILRDTKQGHVVTLISFFCFLRASSEGCKCFLHWTVVFTWTIMSAAKPWLNCRLHCSRMSSCPCHMKERVSLIHWDFYRFRKWRGKTHTYLLDFDEGFSKAEERCFIGSISAWNAMTKSAFIWIVIYRVLRQFNHASSL